MLLAALAILIKGADLFVDGAARLARGMGVSSLAVGLTVVAFGTSLPELFVNLSAAVHGGSDIALGNVVGSNIANILFILGISALIRPLTVGNGIVGKAIACSLLATVLLWVLASDVYLDGAWFSILSRSDGLMLLAFFMVFLAYSASMRATLDGLPVAAAALSGQATRVAWKMIIGFGGLLFGGRWVVRSAAALAGTLAMPESVMGLTVVALGTSLPELAASAMAARRGEVEIAVGNVVGSNLFNLLFVLGASAVIRPLPFNPSANVDMGVMAAAGILLFIFLCTGRVRLMGRWEGALALLVYGLYLGYRLGPICFPGMLDRPAG